MGILLYICKLKLKIYSLLARYPVSYKWPTYWWRKCGYNIGDNSIISPYCLLWGTHHSDTNLLTIEDDVHIGPYSILVLRTHPASDIAKYGKISSTISGSICIKKGSWIGASVTILPNVTIGEGSIVGAGAVVTKNVDSYTIVAGVPAKKIRTLK
ncbi:acyltransferase [Methanolobus profundi]|uniref:Transferase hexapeptide (Six repeat-containing protein) n=1 Tax=Methanolobus profundi TaxID=487685 RepID=A0A1I4RY76_9EURY|nr:acyltransferase [Methanolobus profundi]SFM56940.1 transferase hexapeptide (six repeat-containing protein) [Methanolobus profundi]